MLDPGTIDLYQWTSAELHTVVWLLKGHGGNSPLHPCGLCQLKDEARAILGDRHVSEPA